MSWAFRPLNNFVPVTYTRRTFTPDVTSRYVFSTCEEINWDSRIVILSTCGDPASQVTCNDDCAADIVNFSSKTPPVFLVGGTTYYIAIGGFDATVAVDRGGILTISDIGATDAPSSAPTPVGVRMHIGPKHSFFSLTFFFGNPTTCQQSPGGDFRECPDPGSCIGGDEAGASGGTASVDQATCLSLCEANPKTAYCSWRSSNGRCIGSKTCALYDSYAPLISFGFTAILWAREEVSNMYRALSEAGHE